MIELKNASGAVLRLEGDDKEQVKFWEGLGYSSQDAKPAAKKTTTRKASSSTTDK